MITLATEKLFGHGQEDDDSVMAWRSFKLSRKIGRSNDGETQALAFAGESLWLVRLAWSEMHGASMRGKHVDETVRQVGGMLITDSRSMFDALTRSESSHLRLRSSRISEEARGIKEQCVPSPMLAFTGSIPESFLVKKRWRSTFDTSFRVWQTPESKRCTFVQSRRLGRDQSLNRVSGVRGCS